MFGNDRDGMRRFFLDAWRKAQAGEPMQPLEQLIADVVAAHPEYHALLADDERAITRDFTPESGQSNPFLHMGMHITIAEQLASERPPGIRDLYQQMTRMTGDAHEAEHQMMECLGQTLWEAQRAGRQPDEQDYLACLQRLLKSTPR
jgi:hypothetical protein